MKGLDAMKKISLFLLFLVFLLPHAVMGQDDFLIIDDTDEAAVIQPGSIVQVQDHLTVGNTTPMHGKFFTELWEDVTSDGDVRNLIHGYNLVMWDGEKGVFAHDPSVVNAIGVRDNEAGDRSYLIALHDNLYYSDGTRITAWDYAFSYLLSIAPEIDKIGGHAAKRDYLYGYSAYMDGTVSYLAGVQVLADDQLMITLDHEYLPFFYEIGLLSCNPYPISVIAPGVEVRDDGYGVYLANIDPSDKVPLFSADLLEQTILDPEIGYQSHPSVTSGPYIMTSWDGVTAEFVINPWYKGNHAGKLPLIPYLTYTLADNDSMVQKLRDGEFDLLNKVTRAETVTGALQLIGQGYKMTNYPRTGIAFISFNGSNPALQSKSVRQAMTWCMDRDELIGRYTGYYGLRVDSYYGLGQWMYGIVNGTTAAPVDPPENENDYAAQAAYERELAEWDALNLDKLTVYTLDTTAAAALLDEDGWTLNSAGIREKEIDGQKVMLSFTMLYPAGNTISKAFEELWIPNLREVGIELTLKAIPMQELIERYTVEGNWDADLVFIARNFEGVYDPSGYFLTDGEGNHTWFTTGIADEELYQAAVDMRETQPGEVLEYVTEWVRLMELFNESLPMIPVYSNVYFDFFSPLLQDYYISQNESWGQAIIGAWMGDAVEEEVETFEEGDEFEEFDEFVHFENDGGEFTFFDDAETELFFDD